jgi:branched-chain amino acid transport system substrate-binding protein
VLGTDADQADAGVSYLQTVLNAKKTYIVADDSEFGTTGGTEAKRKLGASVAGTVNVGRNDADFAAAVKQVTDSGADSVYCACYYDDGATIIKAIRTAKPTIAVMAGDKVFTQSFIDGTGTQGQNVYMTCPCVPADQAGDNFAADYKAKFTDQASYYGPEAYDATNIYLAGLQAGASTRQAMLDFVNKYSGHGVSRSIKFTVSGDLDVSSLDIWSYKVDGKYIVSDRVIPGS